MIVQTLRAGFEWLLETIVIALVVVLTAVVIAGFVFRYAGYALVWYDELASIGLVWLTYYGSALAALKGAHIGVPGLVNAMPPRVRVVVTLIAEAFVFLFFIVLAITGLEVLEVLGNDTLVSLDWVPLRVTQSVIPIGSILFIIAEALRLPQLLRDARGAGIVDAELQEALELASLSQEDGARDLRGAGDRRS
ncbi:MAG TPA: TRAP transporter small permease subunit [Xanthobacteraceae bacterium]|nr:TRAP transporter small permease subunit [Xanthobacteraceae bacterium]